jgi:hypothetical protein
MSRPNLPPKQPAEYQIEFGGEISLACVRCPGISADDKQATRWQPACAHPGCVTKPPPDAISDDRAPERTGNHESDPRRNRHPAPRHPGIRRSDSREQVGGEQPAARALTPANRQFEVLTPPHPDRCGKHDMAQCAKARRQGRAPSQPSARMRSDSSGPSCGAPRGSHDPRASACATGSRGSWPDGGCSAEMCAYSLRLQVLISLGHG